MPTKTTQATKPKQKRTQPKNIYRGKVLTAETQAQLNASVAMTTERIKRVRATLIPELRELLDAKVVK